MRLSALPLTINLQAQAAFVLPTNAVPQTTLAKQAFYVHNTFRSSVGLDHLLWSDDLMNTALGISQDCNTQMVREVMMPHEMSPSALL
jgi:uncharacterized protein YkwD